jgi:hypothetical protein
MPSSSLALEAIPELWNDNIWDRLLDSLDERSVIPIVGPDLLQVEVDGEPMLLDTYVAQQLSRVSGLPGQDLPADRPLNHVVCQLIRLRKDRFGICDDILQIMKATTFQPSRALRQLAEITAFNLFVSTTFDSLLERAIDDVRFGNMPATASISYSPRRPDDLPCEKSKLPKPTVYHLMGKLSGSGTYVISDEDVLEYICELQSASRRPELLLDELKKNHLLVLGTGYSDWLSRFFLRTAKGGRLSATRESVEILADNHASHDTGLVAFLIHFSSHTRVFRAGGAIEFVDELWKRWRERCPVVATGSPAGSGLREQPRNAIFISYAREDAGPVQVLRSGLEAAGLPVWFDQSSLRAGDSFHPQIEAYITRECSCFLAIVSRNTETRLEGYFRREWNLALERDRGIHHERPFIVPVVVDDTMDPAAVPPRFRQLNFTWLPGGRISPLFVDVLRQIVRGTQS